MGYEARLWQMAEALRNVMGAAEYEHVLFGLIFLKYVSDAVAAKRVELDAKRDQGGDLEDPDEYRAANALCIPKEARWEFLIANAPQPTLGTPVDDVIRDVGGLWV